MKKLILFLLISGGLSAQVVIPKSTTTFSNVSATGTLKVASTSTLVGKVRIGSSSAPSATLDVTGTMSVSSSATVAGQFNGAAAVFTGNVFASSNLKVGSQSSNNATADIAGTFSVSSTSTLTGAAKQTNTLNYEGNTTWNTNQTNTLTTGNTGTVAVLSDAVFPVTFNCGSYNPSDAAIVYIGNTQFPSGAIANSTITLPYNVTLVSWNYNGVVNGVLGTAENATLAVNYNGSDYVLNSTATHSVVYNSYSGTGLSQNFSAGDRISFKTTFPTWATNPTGLLPALTLWFVRRQ